MKNFLIMAFAAAAAAAPATADPETDQLTIVVAYTAADLATPEARATLEKRVRQAIRRACDVPGPPSTESSYRVSACIDQAWKDAAPKVELALSSGRASSTSYSE